ncbi:MAG: Omp28 family outer membrane lipoprotein [Bacteroidaceae bacterium]|nr:Omp28 family outer membrane lipoprotein [Bacteroidaceae bacterium]
MKRYSYINKVREWVKGVLPFGILCLIPLCCSCSHIADDEQLIYVKPETAKRTVLLEDFTGQKCVNCPKGTEVIEQLQEAYGDNIVAVGIYSGDFGKLPNGSLLPLTTTTGCEYFDNYVKGYGQPIGMVNRKAPLNYPDWMTAVRNEIAKPASIELSLTASINGNTINICVNETALSTNIKGKLQVWVLEDGITTLQFMPDGSANKNYVHNHVFRTAVNGTWGEDVTLKVGEEQTQNMSQTISADWNTQNLSIVAFVYNDNGVEQAIKTKVTQ